MIRTTRELCKVKNAQIELLHMVPVPDQIPLSDAYQYMWEGKEAIVEALLYLQPSFPINTTIRYCRNAARGIVSAVRQKKVDLLIMGWHGKPRSYGFSLGSTVDPIIERAPCNVVILRDGGQQSFKRILVPVAGGPNGAFALEMASILIDKEEGKITAFSVLSDLEAFKINDFIYSHKERLHVPPQAILTKNVQSSSVVNAILKESEQYDLVVMGSTRRPFVYRMTHESVPDTVAQKCKKPLIMVKSSAGIGSWLKRWI